MRILLITNYREDRQKSMIRFGNLLASSIADYGVVVSEAFPKSKMQRFCFGSKFKKWAGYIDKYFFFQKKIESLLQLTRFDLIHIIDHSNSVYLPKISTLCSTPKLITCHDLIAIRTAFEEFSMAPTTSPKGKKLQRWILNSLKQSDFYACDSKQTQSDLINKIPEIHSNSSVIHLGVQNHRSKKLTDTKSLGFDLKSTEYALHVGNDSWYKNRKGVLESFIHTTQNSKNFDNKLILVGPTFQSHELNIQLKNWLKLNHKKIIFLPNVSEAELQALYQHAKILIFPSFIEGFGWPPLEAHSNNCNSITSKTGAIFELLGDNPYYIDPCDQKQLNNAVEHALLLKHKKNLGAIIPDNKTCAKNYAYLYKQIIAEKNS